MALATYTDESQQASTEQGKYSRGPLRSSIGSAIPLDCLSGGVTSHVTVSPASSPEVATEFARHERNGNKICITFPPCPRNISIQVMRVL